MQKAGIEYLDMTWNPLAMRCSRVSAGCANCWHLAMAARHGGNPAFTRAERRAYRGDGPPALVSERTGRVLRRKKPAVIGVQFMGDLFHEKVTVVQQLAVFEAMSWAPQHTFLVLTKRPARMRERLYPKLEDVKTADTPC
jgi:Bacteriophage protein gp37